MSISFEKRDELKEKLERAYRIVYKDDPVKLAQFGNDSSALNNPFTNTLSKLLIERFEDDKKEDEDKLGLSSDTIWRLLFHDYYLNFNSVAITRIEGFCDEVIKEEEEEELKQVFDQTPQTKETQKVETLHIEAENVTIFSKKTIIKTTRKIAITAGVLLLGYLPFWVSSTEASGIERCCIERTNLINQAIKDLKRKQTLNITKNYIENILFSLEDSNCSEVCKEIKPLGALSNQLFIFLSERNKIEQETIKTEGGKLTVLSKENIETQIAACNLISYICKRIDCTEDTINATHKIKTDLKTLL